MKYSVQTTQFINRISVLCIVLAVLVIGWFALRGSLGFSPDAIVENPDNKKVSECVYERLLDGVCVVTEAEVNPQLVTIMIENSLEARPQYGLSKASIVYESPVEANFTRFMAVFPATSEVSQIGPVRSARPYYLDWLAEYGTPPYLHVGGSNEALAILKERGVFDVNEFYRGWLFWRGTDRLAPHNVYTNSTNWNEALTKYASSYTTNFSQGWKFEDIDQCLENCTVTTSIVFNGLAYSAEWRYNTTTMDYVRYQSGEPHTDGLGGVMTADTIVIQRVTSQVLDNVGRLDIDTLGSGEVIVLRRGHKVTGTWKKESVNGRTRFYDAAGVEIPLQRGKIWVEIVNERTEVK
jgi:hypothetical protein